MVAGGKSAKRSPPPVFIIGEPTPAGVAEFWQLLPGCGRMRTFPVVSSRSAELNHRLRCWQAFGLLSWPEIPGKVNGDKEHGEKERASEKMQRL